MDVIYWLIPLSLAILGVAVAIFFWAVRNGQFQDLDSASMEILFDDDSPQSHNDSPNPNNDSKKKPTKSDDHLR